ncbi:MAG: 3-oxoacyl-[acyl-carrier-protein] synthase [Myxococcales bacterium]|nr:3-oxoacyl-[acyl-carrier-protein] synthase [Myxococcales bacterium]
MTSRADVGILGLGLYLPPEVRRNDWWPQKVVAGWSSAAGAMPPPPQGSMSEGTRRVLRALAQQDADPFQGAVERRVMTAGMSVLDMEEAAAREAIQRSGVDPSSIDLLLTHTVLPDYLLSNPATVLHHRLGLPKQCFAMPNDAAAYSFMMQLAVAEAMIASGRATCALLVQSCGASRMIDWHESRAPLFGDGATAVIVGRVSPGRGLRAAAHFADGRYPNTLIGSVPGGTWFDEGRGVIHVEDNAQMRDVFLRTADVCKEGIDAALAQARIGAAEIDFFAMYQGTPWLRQVVQDFAGLDKARSIETFATTGYLFSAILPAGLHFAEQANQLHDDDLVLLTGGGTGMTYGSIVLRWGR